MQGCVRSLGRTAAGVTATVLALGSGVPPASGVTGSPASPELLRTDLQPYVSSLAGLANLDGIPGLEILAANQVGGFYVGRSDGSVLWRHSTPMASLPSIIPDVTGDGRSEIAATVGNYAPEGEVLVADGGNGDVLWRAAVTSIVGPMSAGDLNGDQETDIAYGTSHEEVRLHVRFGPAFAEGWSTKLATSTGIVSLEVTDLNADGHDEIAAGTRPTSGGQGEILLLDGDTGVVRWRTDAGSILSIGAVAGRIAAVSWEPAPISRAELRGLDPVDGSVEWTTPVAGAFTTAEMKLGDLDGLGGPEAVVAAGSHQQGTLAFGLDPSSFVIQAFDLATGAPRWVHKTARDVDSISLVPSLAGGRDVVYGTAAFLGMDTGDFVSRLDGRTGEVVWNHVHAPETISDQVAGLAAGDVDGDGVEEVVYGSREQRFTSLDLSDGSVEARRAYPGVWTASDAGDLDADGRLDLVGGGLDGLVQARGPDGVTRWAVPVGGQLAGVAIAGDEILAVRGGAEAAVYRLDPRDGGVRSSVELGLASDGVFTSHQHDFGDVTGDGVVDVVVAGHESDRPSVVAVDGSTGAIAWRALSPLEPGQPPPTVGSVIGVGIVDGDVVAAITTRDRGLSYRVARIDGATGDLLWHQKAGPGGAEAEIFDVGDATVVVWSDYYLSALSADGTVAWTHEMPITGVFALSGQRLVAAIPDAEFEGTALTVFGSAGVVSEVASVAFPWPTSAGPLPNGDVGFSSAEGTYLVAGSSLGSGEVEVIGELHLPTLQSTTGDPYEGPITNTLYARDVGNSSFLVASPDRTLFTGYFGRSPGTWIARLVRTV